MSPKASVEVPEVEAAGSDMAFDPSVLMGLVAELNALKAELATLREKPVQESAESFTDTSNDPLNRPLPSNGEAFPKRFYSPLYMFMQVERTDSRYPLRYQNGQVVVYNADEETLARKAGLQEFVDDMEKARVCKVCGFRSWSIDAWFEHINRGPHAVVPGSEI